MQQIKISIITVCYNSENTIVDTLESVLSQNYTFVEYIIVDGKSNDNTINLIKSYEHRFLQRGYEFRCLSEKDSGIYNAMNKGIKMATGDIIGILNSDDIYYDKEVLTKVVSMFTLNKIDLLYGDMVYFESKERDKVIRKWKVGNGQFQYGWNPPHPTTFIAKHIYDTFGCYNEDYKISSDYDLLYRLIVINHVNTFYLKYNLVKMRVGGRSTSGLKSNIIGSKEIYLSLKKYKHKFKILTVILRLIRKVKQFI